MRCEYFAWVKNCSEVARKFGATATLVRNLNSRMVSDFISSFFFFHDVSNHICISFNISHMTSVASQEKETAVHMSK